MMIPSPLSYTIYDGKPLTNHTAPYSYVLAGNGLFVYAEHRLFSAVTPVSEVAVRGLPTLKAGVTLKVPKLPRSLLDTIIDNARTVRTESGQLLEALYRVRVENGRYSLSMPDQVATPTSVQTEVKKSVSCLLEIHSHGKMPAFFSPQDDKDEQGLGLFGVAGKLEGDPTVIFRVSVYGYFMGVSTETLFGERQ